MAASTASLRERNMPQRNPDAAKSLEKAQAMCSLDQSCATSSSVSAHSDVTALAPKVDMA